MKPNHKKIARLKRKKIPFQVVGELVIIEGDPMQRIITGKEEKPKARKAPREFQRVRVGKWQRAGF